MKAFAPSVLALVLLALAGCAMGRYRGTPMQPALVAEDLPRWEQASSISHVGPHAPPFFILHGTNDSLVPVEQARTFADELRKTSTQPVVYAEMPGAQHAFDCLPSARAHHTAHAIERFLAVIRSEHGGPTPREAVSADASSA